jgi:hypothetical protein
MTLVVFTLTAGTGVLLFVATRSAWAPLAGAIVLVALALAVASLLFPAAARAVSLRRENLAMIAQGR